MSGAPHVSPATTDLLVDLIRSMKDQEPDSLRYFWRIASTVAISEETGCWLWTDGVDDLGYARINPGFRGEKRAHRISHFLFNGPIPEGHVVRHQCDVRHCVSPRHLLTGTQMENAWDAVRRGRMVHKGQFGTENGAARLTDEVVREIRRLSAAGWTTSQMVERFHVSRMTINRAARRESWRHVA